MIGRRSVDGSDSYDDNAASRRLSESLGCVVGDAERGHRYRLVLSRHGSGFRVPRYRSLGPAIQAAGRIADPGGH
ncbi:MAG: hypothetical protein J2P23_01195 [Microlunatus sp.]|nr:hypothetical protein [Microlunatus sp.]